MKVLTVGYAGLTLERLAFLLEQHGAETLVDVRTSPASPGRPQFDREHLQESFPYVWLGDRLGGRPTGAYYGSDGKVEPALVWCTPWFVDGIHTLRKFAAPCLLCAEADPRSCHRSRLVGEFLSREGDDVFHILPSGVLLPHKDAAPPRKLF